MLIQSQLDALPSNDDWAVRAIEILLCTAQQLSCSDLHVLCQRTGIIVRGRCKGDLIPFANLPTKFREILIARFKILAKLPTFIRHEPQDGRIEWQKSPDERPLILRISFLPTIHGENIAVRFPEEEVALQLDSLGMSPPVLSTIQRLLSQPEGTMLLTGPSSSGKTSTIYAMLAHMNALHGDRLNFLTIEDPVERDLGFAGQIQVDEIRGLTFQRALRTALRQDPNVLMIGEIRDLETAQTALQAGVTGHMVLSTLHAGRSALVFSRLLSLGVSRYLTASALTGVLAQRLVRLLCRQCRNCNGHGGYSAKGCAGCNGTGHEGRTGVFELIQVSEDLRACILSDALPDQIALQAVQAQIGSLSEQARSMMDQGMIDRREYETIFLWDQETRNSEQCNIIEPDPPTAPRVHQHG